MIVDDDDPAREVAAMQFAGGMSIARLAEEWDRGQAWVEEAIRAALLKSIPRRDGGLKVSRAEARATKNEELQAIRSAQEKLGW